MDIQRLLISISDLRGDIGRLRGRVGSMDTMLIGVTILLGINCVATIIIGIAVWNNGG
tara:strand:+ start:916 stop:1089 length:174 start_codon:yes stop_codon:yes gene_type:complete